MLFHGMAEHAGRHERLAAALNCFAAGYHFYAIDQRATWAADNRRAGPTWPASVAGAVVGDLSNLNHRIRQQHPELPIFLLGHARAAASMAYLLHHSCRSLQGGDPFRFQLLSPQAPEDRPPDRPLRALAPGGRWARSALDRTSLSVRLVQQGVRFHRTAFDLVASPRSAGSRQVRG
ncbi:alpha/beta hydrolase [Pseudomonas aeruginosa]|nr:alpha/beta hydrolase [Pseudomonas aeruginosa]